MRKNSKEELQLSEEQQQEITGGCAQCLADLAVVANRQARANGLMNAADTATEVGGSHGALQLHNQAQTHLQRAQNLLEEVITRHQGSVPDLNHPPR